MVEFGTKKKETTLFINKKINMLWYIHSSMQLLKEQLLKDQEQTED